MLNCLQNDMKLKTCKSISGFLFFVGIMPMLPNVCPNIRQLSIYVTNLAQICPIGVQI